MLTLSGIAFGYHDRAVLDGIGFSAAPGEILAVLGPNGVGKTTLLKCINAIHRPDGGTVYVDGKDLLTQSPKAIARTVGYVAQHSSPTRLTVFDAVLLGRRPHVQWGVSQKDLRQVDAALKKLGLTDLALRYIDQISGGELQKVSVARALVQEPRLMLLDEPTSSLDLKNQVEILDLIRRVVTEHELTAVMTMHDLNTAFYYADTCIFLKDRQIFFAGSPADVGVDVIEAVYGLPVEIYKRGDRLLVAPISEQRGSSHEMSIAC